MTTLFILFNCLPDFDLFNVSIIHNVFITYFEHISNLGPGLLTPFLVNVRILYPLRVRDVLQKQRQWHFYLSGETKKELLSLGISKNTIKIEEKMLIFNLKSDSHLQK